jgi:hypothetical protein
MNRWAALIRNGEIVEAKFGMVGERDAIHREIAQ